MKKAQRRFSRAAGLVLLCLGVLAHSGCSEIPAVRILTPTHGAFSTSATVDVTGQIFNMLSTDAEVRVNDVPVALTGLGAFSTTVTLDPSIVFNPIHVQLTDLSTGYVAYDRVVVIAGESLAASAYSLQSIALRINDSGLDAMEEIVADLVDFDPSTLVPVGTEVLDECVVFDPLFGFCLGSARVTIIDPPPTSTSFGITMDSMTDFIAADVLVTDLLIHLDIDGSGLVPSCPLDVSADTTEIFGDYTLDPDAADPSEVDVTQLPGVSVVFGNFQDELFGLCGVPIIGDIIQLFLPNIESLFGDGFVAFLEDPDGAGPLDAPIADAIELALAEIDISGPVGEGIGVVMETPSFDIPEDEDGLTVGSDTSVVASTGGGPGQCPFVAGSPILPASYHVPETFPSFGPLTPTGLPYDVGICISTSAFNQLLRAQTECGLLQLELTTVDFGSGPLLLTTGLLGLFIPEFNTFPPSTPLRLALQPTLAPIVTGNAGPAGELAELRIGHLVLSVEEATAGVEGPLLEVAVDFKAGLELLIDAATGQLAPTVTSLDPADVSVALLSNLIQTEDATVQAALPNLLSVALPSLGKGLGAFPIPGFLGLELDPVSIEVNGEFMSIFADLTTPLLVNGGMEDDLDGIADGLAWEGDLFAIAMTENAVEPMNGLSMLRFDGTTPAGAASGPDAEITQVVDLSAYAAQIATGATVVQATSFVNRIDAGSMTDTEFRLRLEALDGGSGVLDSVEQALLSDGDVLTWEGQFAALLLPAATTDLRLSLVASEDVLEDTSAPEFDGHYVDNVRANVLELVLLENGDMEDMGDLRNDGMGWEDDPFTIVGAENGIVPNGGASMMRFDATHPSGGSVANAALVKQSVDVTEYASLIATGTSSVHVSAYFNRVDFDAETDTQFRIVIVAKDAGGSTLANFTSPFITDANLATWEFHQNDLVMPVGTVTVETRVIAFENVFDDVVAPEFDGHYADDVQIWITP